MAWDDTKGTSDSLPATEWNAMVTDQKTRAVITDTSTTSTVAWSASKITSELSGKASTIHTQASSTITDFDTEVSNNTNVAANTLKETNVTTNLSEGTATSTTVDVNSSDGTNATLVSASTTRAGLLTKAKWDEIVANTSARHDAVTVTDTAEIDLTLTGQDIQASIKSASIDETKLDTSVNASLDLADNSSQIYSGAGAPAGAPAGIGDIYVDNSNFVNYISTDTNFNTDWVLASNATHTGDVTGSTALTIATDAVDIPMLSATGTASSTTFLRGDNTWSSTIGGIADVVDDTTPTLGGDLTGADKNITGIGSIGFTQELDNGSQTGNFSVDFGTDQKQMVTLTANTITLTLDTTFDRVGNYVLKIVNGGLATLTWASESGSVYWPGGTAPTLTSSGTDVISFYYDGTNFYGVASLAFA